MLHSTIDLGTVFGIPVRLHRLWFLVPVLFILQAGSVEAAPRYTNSKTYQLGDLTFGPFNDRFYRRVYTTTVLLRNPAAQRNF